MNDAAYYKNLASQHLINNYGVREIVLARGEGCRVWDADGREYLDFLAGISVVNLGHCHPAVSDALAAQAKQLMHCSNLYLIPQQAELAAKLCELTFAERCFFANSGAEVNEGAVKLARLYSKKKHGDNRYEVITMRNSFHGRTLAMISATGQEKVQKGFEPLVEGFHYATYNDIESVRAQITSKTCAIMLEPVQGEGGIVPATKEFLQALRAECDKHNLLLIFDEIQCGVGRCGKLYAYEISGVVPDILTSAKALGNGMPIGALLTTDEIAKVLEPGTHGTTFGGNPLACSAALAVLNTMVSESIPARSAEMGEFFRGELKMHLAKLETVKEIRGAGLMTGIVLSHPGAEIVKACAAKGLLINCTMGNILRILPPLIVSKEECSKAAKIIAEVLVAEAATMDTAKLSQLKLTGARA